MLTMIHTLLLVLLCGVGVGGVEGMEKVPARCRGGNVAGGFYRKQKGAPKKLAVRTLSVEVQEEICAAVVERAGREQVVTVVPTNLAHLELARSSFCTFRTAAPTRPILFMALDLATLTELTETGYPAFPSPAGLGM